MLKILLFTISLFTIVFLEHFFVKIFSFSLFALIGIYLWNRGISWWYVFIFAVIGLILDVTMHMPLGLHILALGGSILFLWIAKTFIPTEGTIQESVLLLISTFFFYILSLTLYSFIVDFTFPSIQLITLVYILIKSAISVVIYLLLTVSTQSFRSKDFEKIRLR